MSVLNADSSMVCFSLVMLPINFYVVKFMRVSAVLIIYMLIGFLIHGHGRFMYSDYSLFV